MQVYNRKFAPWPWHVTRSRVAPDCQWSHTGLVVAWPGWPDAATFGGSLNEVNNYSQPDPIHPRRRSFAFAARGLGFRGRTYQQAAGQSFNGGPTVCVSEASVPNFPTGPCSVVLHYRKLDTTNRNSAAFGNSTNVAAGYLLGILPNASGRVRWLIGASELFVDSLTFGDDVWVFTNGARGMEIWQNGILRASNGTNATRTGQTTYWGLFGAINTVGFASDFAESGCCLLYNRQLPVDELQALTLDPWTPFRPARRRAAKAGASGSGRRSFIPAIVG